MSNSPPPPKANNDVIVITRLNTVGLKRLAEGTLVEKSLESKPPAPPTRASSKPPEPARLGPSSMPPALKSEPAMPKPVREMQSSAEILDVGDLLGPDAEDKTLGLGADASEDRTIAVKTPPPPQMAPFMGSIERVASDRDRTAVAPVDRTKIAAARAEPALVVDPRLEMETPTALFVKDIQATLKEELAKQQREAAKAATPVPPPPAVFQLPPLEIAPLSESAGSAKRDTGRVDKSAPLPNKNARPVGVLRSQPVPPPPTSKPASLAPPAAKSTSSLPAPLPAQANRRKDPSGMSVSTRPARIERKGGFFPWAAALTALGVFVGVAGARVATGGTLGMRAPLPGAAQAIAHASEPGFAPKVVVPTEETKPAEVAKAPEPPAPEPAKVEAKVEPKPAAPVVAAEVATTKAPAKEPVAEKTEKVEAKEEKAERVWERPRPRRAAPPPVERAPEKTEKVAEKPEPKPEPVAAKPRPAEKPAEKTEPAPKPPTKSPDVSAAARDYAAVESQLGQSL